MQLENMYCTSGVNTSIRKDRPSWYLTGQVSERIPTQTVREPTYHPNQTNNN